MRFHLYWAGSDRDGFVAGFYYAVVETLPLPEPGFTEPPPLPGPKPADYRFVSRTDSIFIFNVSEVTTDRQHAFFIYAVDNQGKADPTPARFIFVARDNFPPKPVLDVSEAVGTIYKLQPGGGVIPEVRTYTITDSLIAGVQVAPKDTVPSKSTLTFQWHGEPRIPGSVITGYRYKLDEPAFVAADSSVHEKVYAPPIATDVKVFTLKAVDQASGTDQVTRRFQYNFAPDTWFAGPDLSRCTNCVTKPNGEVYVWGPNVLSQGVTGSLLSSDSAHVMPALRDTSRMFFEIYRDTVYIRSEGDTIHMNSWVVLHMGGLDIDSPYTIKTTPLSPQYFPGEVATPGPPNGSPIGFRTAQVLRTSPGPGLSIPAQSGLFPICDPNDINDNCKVGAYLPMFQSGQIYVVARAEDGDHTIDRRIPDARLLVQSYDNGSATPYERTLRKKVLVFHVNKPPFFQLSNPLFQPLPARVDTFTTNLWHMELYADDEDPFLAGTPVGVPQPPNQPKTLRRRITILGVNSQGDSLRFNDGQSYFDPVVNYFIPPATDLRAGRAIVSVELCDCSNCDNTYGGRCVTLQIPVEYRPSGPLRTQRPGSGGLSSRSEGP